MEWAPAPPKMALPGGVLKARRATEAAGQIPVSPKRARASGWRGGRRMGPRMVVSGEGKFGGAGTAANRFGGFDDEHRSASSGQGHRCRQAVGTGADHHCVVATHAFDPCFAGWITFSSHQEGDTPVAQAKPRKYR